MKTPKRNILTLSRLKLCEIWSFQYVFVPNSRNIKKKKKIKNSFIVFQTEKCNLQVLKTSGKHLFD